MDNFEQQNITDEQTIEINSEFKKEKNDRNSGSGDEKEAERIDVFPHGRDVVRVGTRVSIYLFI